FSSGNGCAKAEPPSSRPSHAPAPPPWDSGAKSGPEYIGKTPAAPAAPGPNARRGGKRRWPPAPSRQTRGEREIDASGDARVLHRPGRMTRPVLDGGTAEPVSDLVELAQVGVREVGVALAEVLDRLLHPVALILLRRLENATTVDVAEQLVSRSIQKLLFGQVLPPSVLPCPPDPILARFGPQPSNVTVQAGETKSRRGRELDGSRYPFSGPGSRPSRASA